MTTNITKLMPVIVIVLAYPLSTSADPLASGNLNALKQCNDAGQWLLIEVNSDKEQLQSQCVELPTCPLGTEAVDWS